MSGKVTFLQQPNTHWHYHSCLEGYGSQGEGEKEVDVRRDAVVRRPFAFKDVLWYFFESVLKRGVIEHSAQTRLKICGDHSQFLLSSVPQCWLTESTELGTTPAKWWAAKASIENLTLLKVHFIHIKNCHFSPLIVYHCHISESQNYRLKCRKFELKTHHGVLVLI